MDDHTRLISDSDPILHQRLDDFDFESKKPGAKNVERFLIKALKHHQSAGIAANQIGLPYRAFAMLLFDEPFVAFNPTITELSIECVNMKEGCLTFPDLELTIRRPKTCRMNYSDSKGERQTIVLNDWHARVALHENDHLNGVVFTSKALPPSFIFTTV